MSHPGACHCGAVRLTLGLTMAPEAAAVRACACSFCRRHGARTLTDRMGRLTVTAGPGGLNRYRFGLETADYLLCARCGVYLAAVMPVEAGAVATLNVNALEARDRFDRAPPLVDYSGETRDARIARRAENWMPVDILERDGHGAS